MIALFTACKIRDSVGEQFMTDPQPTGSPVTAAFYGFAQWIGEAVIGLIPWIVYVYVNTYSDVPITGLCSKQSFNQYNKTYMSCAPLSQSASQEICILAVVISGLAVLSVVTLGARHRPITIWTRLLTLMAILALIFGALSYGFFMSHLDRNADTITYAILAVALFSSLCLAIEGAILSA
jgi:hypothetical protein